MTGPETADDQVARLLALVPYLLAQGEVRLDEAAERFGVTPKRLDKDLRLLFLTGMSPGLPGDLIEVDIDALEGERVVRVSNADYLARPIRFAPAEATALMVALGSMLDQAGDDARPVVESTLEKLRGAVGGEAETMLALHVEDEPAEAAEYATILEDAIRRGRQVRLDYHVPSRDERTERVVDPRAIARVENVLYLDAWCHTAAGERVFRLDRILQLAVLDSPVADSRQRARDLTDGWFTDAHAATVTLRLAPAAYWVREYYPILAEREGPDSAVEVDIAVSSEVWLTRLLLRLAPHATVVEPRSYGLDFSTAVRETLSLYGMGE